MRPAIGAWELKLRVDLWQTCEPEGSGWYGPGWSALLSATLYWVAVKELNLSYHNMDIQYIYGF